MHDAFQNRTVVITGASAGIGAALAREFAAQKADLLITARRKDRLDELAAELRAQGTKILTAVCDVTRDGDFEKALELARGEFGHIDVVVANAGFGVVGRFEKLSVEDYRRQFETNVFGVIRTAQPALEDLKKSRGSLVLLGSVSSYISAPNASPYSMSKFAIRALAEALSIELRRYGVTVTLISPGFVESEIRKVDNRGQLQPGFKDPMPSWLLMDTRAAARDIVRATAARKRERIVTFHGKVLVAVSRYTPWLIRLATRLGIRGRSEPTR